MAIDVVADISSMLTYSGTPYSPGVPGTTLVVQDEIRGGVFNFNSKGPTITISSVGGSSVLSFNTSANHHLSPNDRVVFSSGTALPNTLNAGFVYYILSEYFSPNQFAVALEYEGTPIAYPSPPYSGGAFSANQVYTTARNLQVAGIATTSPTVITTSIPYCINNGDQVVFSGSVADLTAAGITAGTPYLVVNVGTGSPILSTTTFSISSLGGLPVNGNGGTISGTIVIQQQFIGDNGVRFPGNGTSGPGWWIRQYDETEGVNVMWFGLAGDGITDDSVTFQNAYNVRHHTYNFPVRDFLIGNINLGYPNICLRSESAIYDTGNANSGPIPPKKGTRIYLPSTGGVIFYTSADITGSRFYGLQLNGTNVTSGNCRGMIIGKDDDNIVGYPDPVTPYTNYPQVLTHRAIKCSFEFMQFVGFQQEGWLGEYCGSMIINSCFSTNCLRDTTYLTTYRAALAVYGDDCVIDKCEFGAMPLNTKSLGFIPVKVTVNSVTVLSGSSALVTTASPPPFAASNLVTLALVDTGGPIQGQTGVVTAVTSVFPFTFTITVDTSLLASVTGGEALRASACGIGLFGKTQRLASWITDSYGELCDCGIYIGQEEAKVTACRPDHNAGFGFIIDSSRCQLANCTSFDNGLAKTNTYDGFLITPNAASVQLSNCLNFNDVLSSSGDTLPRTRFGFNDLSNQSTAEYKTIFSNCKSVNDLSGMFIYTSPLGCGARTTENGPEITLDNSATNRFTPSVADWGMWVTNNNSVTVITNFIGGFPGQVIYVRINDIFTTIQSNSSIQNKNGVDISGVGGVFQYKYQGGVWYQVVPDQSGILFTQTVIKNITNLKTASIINNSAGGGIGTLTLPANFFFIGRTIRIKIAGIFSTPTSVASSLLVSLNLGAAAIASTSSVLALAASAHRFVLEVDVTCISVTVVSGGITTLGQVYVDGEVVYYNSPGANVPVTGALNNGGSPVSIDTRSAKTFGAVVTWDVASSDRSISSTIGILEALN